LRAGKVIAKKAVCSFFGPPCRPVDLIMHAPYLRRSQRSSASLGYIHSPFCHS